jgi:hypothetical protein
VHKSNMSFSSIKLHNISGYWDGKPDPGIGLTIQAVDGIRFSDVEGTLVPTAGTLSQVNNATFTNISISGFEHGFRCQHGTVSGVRALGAVSPPLCDTAHRDDVATWVDTSQSANSAANVHTPVTSTPAGKYTPRSWWRFEDASHIGLDTMGNHALHPAAGKAPETVETPVQKSATDGGIVGGFIELNPDGDSKLSWSANASYLPLQCANPRFRDGIILSCPKDDPMLCANGHCPRGLTIELLIKLGPDALKQGNLTLFENVRTTPSFAVRPQTSNMFENRYATASPRHGSTCHATDCLFARRTRTSVLAHQETAGR